MTFDDDTQRAAAESDPMGFVSDLPERVVLDEVQRLPGLFTTLKAAVDARRVPGRFLLTGSANVLLPRLADSLAVKMAVLYLRPLALAEIAGTPVNLVTALFGDGFPGGAGGGQRLGTAAHRYGLAPPRNW